MVTPADVATSAQFRPRIPPAYADNPAWNPPHTQLTTDSIQVEYLIQPEDELGELAQRLYGANIPQNRAHILRQGFRPGNILRF